MSAFITRACLHLSSAPPPPPPTRVKASHPESLTPAVIQQSEQRCNNSRVMGLSPVRAMKRGACSCGETQSVSLSFYVSLFKALEQTVPELGMFFRSTLSFFWVDRCSHLFVETCEGVPLFSFNLFHCSAAKEKAKTSK